MGRLSIESLANEETFGSSRSDDLLGTTRQLYIEKQTRAAMVDILVYMDLSYFL